jgi:hypothetical protein
VEPASVELVRFAEKPPRFVLLLQRFWQQAEGPGVVESLQPVESPSLDREPGKWLFRSLFLF